MPSSPSTRQPQAQPQQRPQSNPGLAAKLRTMRVFPTLADQPGADYFYLRIIIFVLIGIGVVMSYSASMASSLVERDGNVWALAIRQSIYVVLGLIGFWIALKLRPKTIFKLANLLLYISIALLIVVLTPVGTGREEVGSQSWINLGFMTIQPSEIARVAIGIYGAKLLAGRKFAQDKPRTALEWYQDPYIRYLGAAALCFVLIVLQGDVGMGVSFALVVAACLFFAGMNWRVFVAGIIAGLAGMAVLFAGGGYRSNRFHTYFDALVGKIEDTQGIGFQSYQGFLSLADGGASGVGLGQSRAKWFYLPEARNDFVFAIVGEELGLWGGILVIGLFAALAYFGLRTALRAQDGFQAIVAATLATAVAGQAFVNISYVVGLLPVTGIQLPLISSGGSATIITIAAMGVLCNVARHEPEYVSAMQNYGRPAFDRLLGVPEPLPAGAPSEPQRHSRHEAPRRSGQERARAGVPRRIEATSAMQRRRAQSGGQPPRPYGDPGTRR